MSSPATPTFQVPPTAADQYRDSATVKRPRRRSSRRNHRHGHQRLRVTYFAMAAFWGFLIGSAALLVGSTLLGQPLHWNGTLGGVLFAGAGLALLGGAIASQAYRQAAGRGKRH